MPSRTSAGLLLGLTVALLSQRGWGAPPSDAETPAASESSHAATSAPAAESEGPAARRGDPHATAALVRAELELLRTEMGRPVAPPPRFQATGAAPRDVVAQASALFQKANRFAFEQARADARRRDLPSGNVRIEDVEPLLEAVLEQLRTVKQALRIVADCPPAAKVEAPDNDTLFATIAAANNQINLLLERPFAPSDVYQQVTLAMRHAARLLAEFPGATRIPDAPPLERAKRPAEVFGRLLDCLQRTHRIATAAGLQSLEVSAPGDLDEVAPSDVFDLAVLLVAELEDIRRQIDAAPAEELIYYPGRKLPADVYQRAGILLAQLTDLEARLKEAPERLRRSAAPAEGE